jgi:hypothetical protein
MYKNIYIGFFSYSKVVCSQYMLRSLLLAQKPDPYRTQYRYKKKRKEKGNFFF